jgi:transcriptional regulator with XRE-family HTH domain
MKKKLVALRMLDLRLAAGYPQEKIAAVLGIHQPAYSALERGATALSADAADKLAHFYGLSLDEFLHGDRQDRISEKCEVDGLDIAYPSKGQGVCPRQFEQLLERNTALLKIVSERIDTLTALVARLRK